LWRYGRLLMQPSTELQREGSPVFNLIYLK
jgi:hypothetical protein